MINVIFITTIILGGLLKYMAYNTQYYLLLLIFILSFSIFYVSPKKYGEKSYIYVGGSVFLLGTVFILEKFSVISLSLYDSLLFIISLYAAGVIISKRDEELIGLVLVLLIIGIIIYYVPNVTLKDIYAKSINLENINSLPFVDRLKYTYNSLMNLSSFSMYPQVPQETEQEKKKILKDMNKEKEDVLKMEYFPKNMNNIIGGEYSLSLTATNLLEDKNLDKVYVGVDAGFSGRKYGIKINNDEGLCSSDNFNCYVQYDSLPPLQNEISIFNINLPSCELRSQLNIYAKYIGVSYSYRYLYIDKGDMGKTISSDGPLSVDIVFQPQQIHYSGRGNLKFMVNLYTVLHSNIFKKYYSYYKYIVLSTPKEVILKRNDISCPYVRYVDEDNKRNYIFEIKDELSCSVGEKIGVISCEADVDEQDAEKFANGYRMFEVYVPYIFYGTIPYEISTSNKEECNKYDFSKDFYFIQDAKPFNDNSYLMAYEKKYENEDIQSVINEIKDFCLNVFSNSIGDYGCAHIVLKDFNNTKLSITNENNNKQTNSLKGKNIKDMINNLLTSYENAPAEIKIINEYDGGRDLSITADYIFQCNHPSIEIRLR